MGFLSVSNLVPWLIFSVNILGIRAWIVTDQFAGSDSTSTCDYLREAINQGTAIEGWLLFEEIRHTAKHWTRYRILHGKWGHTVFTHELLTYRKSNEWAQRTSEVSDTKTTSAHIPAQSTFHVVLCLLCTYWDIQLFWKPFFEIFPKC